MSKERHGGPAARATLAMYNSVYCAPPRPLPVAKLPAVEIATTAASAGKSRSARRCKNRASRFGRWY